MTTTKGNRVAPGKRRSPLNGEKSAHLDQRKQMERGKNTCGGEIKLVSEKDEEGPRVRTENRIKTDLQRSVFCKISMVLQYYGRLKVGVTLVVRHYYAETRNHQQYLNIMYDLTIKVSLKVIQNKNGSFHL